MAKAQKPKALKKKGAFSGAPSKRLLCKVQEVAYLRIQQVVRAERALHKARARFADAERRVAAICPTAYLADEQLLICGCGDMISLGKHLDLQAYRRHFGTTKCAQKLGLPCARVVRFSPPLFFQVDEGLTKSLLARSLRRIAKICRQLLLVVLPSYHHN